MNLTKVTRNKKMKKIQSGLMILGIALMAGCANKPVMPPLKYNKPIHFQVNKNAYLNWEVGKERSATTPVELDHSGDLMSVLVSSAVDSIDRHNNPSHYTLSYGKAEQIVFMTSLRDVLVQNQVFKVVEVMADSRPIASQDVLINVFFKTARVASPERNYKITLTVELSIQTAQKPSFKRSYVVQSHVEGLIVRFREQQVDVSERLLEKIISAIEEWHHLNHRGSKK